MEGDFRFAPNAQHTTNFRFTDDTPVSHLCLERETSLTKLGAWNFVFGQTFFE
ncbi:hypothetical protein BCR33DRAFT_715376, partial [Rhizoclosmatium globosum]